jgi:hypothetical protein
MLTALILICSLANATNLADCTRQNALDVVAVPAAFANPATCFMHGPAYVAGTSIARDLPANEAIKVICVHNAPSSVDQTERRP